MEMAQNGFLETLKKFFTPTPKSKIKRPRLKAKLMAAQEQFKHAQEISDDTTIILDKIVKNNGESFAGVGQVVHNRRADDRKE